MNKTNIVAGAILSLVILVLVWLYDKTRTNYILELIGIIGTIASLYGIWLTFLQVISIKNETEIIKRTSDETRKKLESYESYGELGKALKLVQEVQSYVRMDKFEIGALRLQELKIVLAQEKETKGIELFNAYEKKLNEINLLLELLEKRIGDKKYNIDTQSLNTQLESVLDFIAQQQTTIYLNN